MHNFLYPVKNSYITNEIGYTDANFSLDSTLEIKSVNLLQKNYSYYFLQDISGSFTSCYNNFNGFSGYISGSSFDGVVSYGTVYITGSTLLSTENYNGILGTGSVISYSGSLTGAVDGSITGSLSGSVDFIVGQVASFTGSMIGTLVGTHSIYQPSYTLSIVPEVSRALLQFDLSEISQSISNGSLKTGSLSFILNLKTAEVKEIPLDYTIHAYPLLSQWSIGTGRYQLGGTTNGVSWNYTDYYGGTAWTSSGGDFYTASNYTASQNFSHANTDIKMDITNIVYGWLSGSISNNGLILVTSLEDSQNPSGYNKLEFFSTETNTIYSPYLDTIWDDSIYTTGSLLPITTSRSFNLIIQNMGREYKCGSIPRINVFARDNSPLKNYNKGLQLNQYTTSSYVPSSTYYSIKDNESEEVIIDFDSGTKLSCDGDINYFFLDTTGLPQERYYRILLKTITSDGRIDIFDNGNVFKISR